MLQKFFELAIGVTSTVAGIIYLLATWQNVQNPRKNCNLSCNLCKCKKSRMGDGSSVEKVESAPFLEFEPEEIVADTYFDDEKSS